MNFALSDTMAIDTVNALGVSVTGLPEWTVWTVTALAVIGCILVITSLFR